MLAMAALLAIQAGPPPDPRQWGDGDVAASKLPIMMFLCRGPGDNPDLSSVFIRHDPKKSVIDVQRETEGQPKIRWTGSVQGIAVRAGPAGGSQMRVKGSGTGNEIELTFYLRDERAPGELVWKSEGGDYAVKCNRVPPPSGRTE